MADKILKILIDHKLHDGEGNLEKGPTLIFPKKGVAAHQDGQKILGKKISNYFFIIHYMMR